MFINRASWRSVTTHAASRDAAPQRMTVQIQTANGPADKPRDDANSIKTQYSSGEHAA